MGANPPHRNYECIIGVHRFHSFKYVMFNVLHVKLVLSYIGVFLRTLTRVTIDIIDFHTKLCTKNDVYTNDV